MPPYLASNNSVASETPCLRGEIRCLRARLVFSQNLDNLLFRKLGSLLSTLHKAGL